MTTDNFHAKIKQQTKPYHDRVEKLPLPSKLYSLSITHEEYHLYLKTLYSIHYTIERQLAAFSQWEHYGIELTEYFRRHLIVRDLRVIKADAPLVHPNLTIENFAKALGYLYVLTGSTMGGMILSKKVQEIFSLSPYHLAHNYFDAFGDDIHSRFLELMKAIESYLKDYPDQEEQIISGAIDCYEYIEKEMM